MVSTYNLTKSEIAFLEQIRLKQNQVFIDMRFLLMFRTSYESTSPSQTQRYNLTALVLNKYSKHTVIERV